MWRAHGDEDPELRRYVVESEKIEDTMTESIRAVMLRYPLVYEEAAQARSTPLELIDAFVSYFTEALPHISRAARSWSELEAPESAAPSHNATTMWLQDMESVMKDGISVLRSGDTEALMDLFLRLEQQEASLARIGAMRDNLINQLDR